VPKITSASLMTLEAYSKARKDFRAKVIAHKRNRTVHLGEHITLLFEDELTMRYQVQEMLRIEKIFEEAGIEAELDAYNPLVPDGSNFKATMLIEYEDEVERRQMLGQLRGIERKVWIQVEGCDKVCEDLERETEEKTSSVHFLRFELTPEMKSALRYGVGLGVGVDHPACMFNIAQLPSVTRNALAGDLI
jgi:Protein of unknown function (DUF3501)